jgi:hypothetical protein
MQASRPVGCLKTFAIDAVLQTLQYQTPLDGRCMNTMLKDAMPRPNTIPFWRARAGNASLEVEIQPSWQGPRPLAGAPPRELV